jgi:hypothetical protein
LRAGKRLPRHKWDGSESRPYLDYDRQLRCLSGKARQIAGRV